MKHITIEHEELTAIVFDVEELMRYLEQLSDSRKARGKRYSLTFLLMTILLAKIAGKQKPTEIAEWIQLRRAQLVQAFQCQRQSVPSLNTIRRTLANHVSLTELQRVLRQYLHENQGGQQSVLVSIDGKTLRGTIPKGTTKGVHLLAAYLPQEGIVLVQVAVGAKENELTAAPTVLKQLDLRQKIVCGDAMFTQRNLSVQIAGQGGDFIWFVKENQSQLLDDVMQFFVPPRKAKGWHIPQLPQDIARSINKGHGRLEKRTLTLMADDAEFIDWPCLRQVFKLERKVTLCRTGITREETVYGITSLPPERANAEQLLTWTRAYWGIENGLHYRRDKTLQEDGTRMSNNRQAQAMATLNNFIIGLVRKLGLDNLASAQRRFDMAINLALFAPS